MSTRQDNNTNGQPKVIQAHGSWAREPGTFVLEEVDSPTSIPDPFAILVESELIPISVEFEPHEHPLHELAFVRGGMMTVRLSEHVIIVPEGHGLWIPAGTVHSGRTTAHVALIDALFEPSRCPAMFSEPVTIEVTSIVASLFTYLEQSGLSEAARLRAEAVVFDVLTPAAQQLTMKAPRGTLVSPIVEALLEDPTDTRTIVEWAERMGVSERTVARQFRKHTGLSFVQWRQALRVHYALELMSEGMTVREVSELLGYSQPSTFITSFKRVMGTTPGAYAPE